MWEEKENCLYGEFIFDDFKAAFAFMTEVSHIAESQHHHPNWTNVYNKVEITLNTHDAGNIVTDKDRVLAKSIKSIYLAYQAR